MTFMQLNLHCFENQSIWYVHFSYRLTISAESTHFLFYLYNLSIKESQIIDVECGRFSNE